MNKLEEFDRFFRDRAKAISAVLALLAVATASFAQSPETNDSISIADLYEQLPEVVVKAEKPIVKLENGKMTYNMSNLLEKLPADNAYDAIKNIPGVSAIGENLTFAGSNVTLIINGKTTTLSQDQAIERLKSMSSAQLQKAEVTLAAPARYHVRGAAINIVTKDYAGQHHTSGQLQGTYNQSEYARGYGKGNLLHVNGNLTLDLNYAYTYGKNYAEGEHDAQHPLNGGRVAYHDRTTSESKGYSHDIRAEVDYRIAESHTINFAYTGQTNKSNVFNETTGSSVSEQNNDRHNYLHNFDLSYTLPFGLRLTGSYTYYKSPRDQRLDGQLDDLERNLTARSNQLIKKWLFTADQAHELGKGWGLNYGLKYQKTNNDSYQTTLDAAGDELPEATSSVGIDERIFNVYAGFSKQIGQGISIDGSVAVEDFHTSSWDDWRVYPSFNATWSINEHHLLNLSFSSDATYPSYWSTMNQIFYSSAYSEIWGNPELKPSRSYNTSLVWQINRKYTLVAFVNLMPNSFMQLPYQPTDRMAVVMQEVNFNHRNMYGVQAMAQFSIGSWLSGNAFATGLYNNDKCDDFFDIAFDRDKFTVILGGNATATLSKKSHLLLMVNPMFQSDAIQGIYDIDSMFKLDASLRWTSRNGAWSVVASGYNLTNRKFNLASTYDNQNFKMKTCQDWVTGALTVIYKFGNYKEKRYKAIDTSRLRK